MAEKFDPYYKWLGIPPKDQPPCHYRLLGLEVFESDPEVIDRAANRLMDYLQGISEGEHVAQSQALLNEIAAARLCLLDGKAKAQYDERLRVQRAETARGTGSQPDAADESGDHAARTVRGKRGRAAEPPKAPPQAPPPAAPPIQLHAGAASDSLHHKPRAKQSPWLLVVGLCACVVAMGGAAIYVLVFRPAVKQVASGPRTDAQAAPPTGPMTGDSRPSGAKQSESPDIGPVTPDSGKTGAVDPPAFPMPKGEPDAPPHPDSAKLWTAANEAIQKKDAKEAESLLEKYVQDPAAPERANAAQILATLRNINSDEFIIGQMATLTAEQLTAFDQGMLNINVTGLTPDLKELFVAAMRRNLPEAKRRLAMKAMPPDPTKEKEKSKEIASHPATPKTTPMPPAIDPLAKPTEYLASRGLTKRGGQWNLNEEPALLALSRLPELEKKYATASAKVADGIKGLNRTLAQLAAAQQQADQAAARNAQPAPAVVQFLNEWKPKIGTRFAMGNNVELQAMLRSRIDPRNELLLAVLKTQQELGPLDEKYRQLAEDSHVAEALSKLPGDKVGPSARLAKDRAKFPKSEALVLGDEVPVFLRGQFTVLNVLVNEAATADVAFSSNQNFNHIPEAVLKKAGVALPADAPAVGFTQTVEGKVREVKCRLVKAPSVRLGKHLLKDVAFFVTGEKDADLGAALHSAVFDGFRTDIDNDNFLFKIRPQDAPEPKVEKKKK